MDIRILQWFGEVFHNQMWLNYVMKYVTYLGEFGAAAIISAVVLFVFGKPAGRASALPRPLFWTCLSST